MNYRDLPYLLVADSGGRIFEDKSLRIIAREGHFLRIPSPDEFMELPPGSDLFFLPEHIPYGLNPKTGNIELSQKGFAVAAFVAPAHTTLALPAWKKLPNAPVLPLFAYTLAGWKNGKIYAATLRVDNDTRQEPFLFDQKKVIQQIKKFRKKYPGNQLLEHLIYCATEYLCPAARNYFLNRWEAPLPTSPTCNCSCRGCISLQPENSPFCSTQQRIKFIPTPEEIAQIAIDHLNTAPLPIVSFGQGCEGEPLLVADVIEEAIRLIRKHTHKGIINLNTNGSRPDVCRRLFKAGLDSIRVSINSFQKHLYDTYFRPHNYAFEDVLETIRSAKDYNKWCSINYFVLPGYTNHPDEFNAFCQAYETLHFSMVQWRNFNIDPDFYDQPVLVSLTSTQFTVKDMITSIKYKYPLLYHGYFNPHELIIKRKVQEQNS